MRLNRTEKLKNSTSDETPIPRKEDILSYLIELSNKFEDGKVVEL